MSFNKVIIVGNLGRDPEMRYTPQGTAVCSFTMATNERRKDRAGEQQDVTTWFKVTVWGRQAETVSQYLHKGKSVYVEGRLRVEEWTDKEGKLRHTLEVNASDVQFIGGGSGDSASEGIPVSRQQQPPARAQSAQGGAQRPAAAGGASGGQEYEADEDDSIPF